MDAPGAFGAGEAAIDKPTVSIVIPALDEERALPSVLSEIPRGGAAFVVREIVVVDNGSRDGTADVARRGGATVVSEPRRGYGAACLAGLRHLAAAPPDVVAFMDADHSDHADELPCLVDPIALGSHDFVVGSRTLGGAERGALLPHARAGNALASALIWAATGVRYSDLGPFRAIRWSSLARLQMRDPGFGWTVEMQVKAPPAGLRVLEVPVRYRRRMGVSKISGTVSGTVRAGAKILYSVARYRLFP